MRIAVCDDSSLNLERICALLDAYRQERGETVSCKTFLSGAELCSVMRAGEYDALLLDVLMPGMNGMDAAREIRSCDGDVKIFFLTSSPEFALESYAVKASDYLLKPVSRERLFEVLDAIRASDAHAPEGLCVRTHSGVMRIPYARLGYVDVSQKKLHFHLVDGSVREIPAPLSELESRLLARPEFYKVHRSYIVNFDQISELTSGELITYRGERVPISRLLYPSVKRAYMEHLFAETGME